MKSAARDDDLMLTFATAAGNYVGNVQVDITDTHGRTLLQTRCDGPIMLVDMRKNGRYHVRGEVAGHAVSSVAALRPGVHGQPLHLVVPGV